MATPPTAARKPAVNGHRLAFCMVVVLLLFILVTLPFALSSVFSDVLDQTNRTYLLGRPYVADGAVRTNSHIDLIALNEFEGMATLRVTMHQSCGTHCPWGDRVVFVSVLDDDMTAEDLPPGETVTLPANARDVTQTIKLPIVGDPIRYPFDRYFLALGIVVNHILPDGSVQTLSEEEARAYLSTSVEARIPRITMDAPVLLDGRALQADGDIEPYAYVALLTFERPLYLKVLTILLVLLVTAAAAYAVFLRPLDQLIINSGALVLGVWGIRAILVGTTVAGVTAVDLGLSVVILFLLVAITVRTLWLLEERSDWRLLRRRAPKPTAEPAKKEPAPPADCVPGRAAPADQRAEPSDGVAARTPVS